METVTILMVIFSFLFFIVRYLKPKRMSLDFMGMIFGLLAVVCVVMDGSLSDNERLVMFFVPFSMMMLSAMSLLDTEKKW